MNKIMYFFLKLFRNKIIVMNNIGDTSSISLIEIDGDKVIIYTEL